MLIETKDIQTLIPHREPMIMIDNLLEQTATSAKTDFRITSENIFVGRDRLTESGLLENAAQTAAAGAGYQLLQKQGIQATIFLAAVNYFLLHRLPRVGETLQTRTVIIHQIYDFHRVRASISCLNEEIAECEITLYVKMKNE